VPSELAQDPATAARVILPSTRVVFDRRKAHIDAVKTRPAAPMTGLDEQRSYSGHENHD
jgi:hypothetical protein